MDGLHHVTDLAADLFLPQETARLTAPEVGVDAVPMQKLVMAGLTTNEKSLITGTP